MIFSYSVVPCAIKVDLCSKFKWSRAFIDLCPGYLRFSINSFFSKTARLNETEIHVGPVWDG